MTQNPPFPSPEELKAKLSEFMKTNFGDKVAFTTYTEPETAQQIILEKLGLSLPPQPPPRIRTADLGPASTSDPVL